MKWNLKYVPSWKDGESCTRTFHYLHLTGDLRALIHLLPTHCRLYPIPGLRGTTLTRSPSFGSSIIFLPGCKSNPPLKGKFGEGPREDPFEREFTSTQICPWCALSHTLHTYMRLSEKIGNEDKTFVYYSSPYTNPIIITYYDTWVPL